METQQPDTALLLFARTAGEEVKSKTFSKVHGSGVNRLIAETLLQHTYASCRESGIPLVPVLSEGQVGSTFGERLANAFQEAFLAGYQRVICIGSDCPTLTARDLIAAKQAMRTANMVVGPSPDGGAYLIGLHIDNFDPESFAMLNWQTNELLRELMLYSYRRQACLDCVCLLEEKSDIDSGADLVEQLKHLSPFHKLRLRLTAIMRQHETVGHPLQEAFPSTISFDEEAFELRAPPVH